MPDRGSGDSPDREQWENICFQASLLEAAGQAIIATDTSGKIVYWNRAAERMYGWPSEEVVGRFARDVLVSRDLRERATEIMDALRRGDSWSGEFTVMHRNGEALLVLASDTPVYSKAGEMIGIVGVSTDITERKRMEEDLRSVREFLMGLLDNAPLPIYTVSEEGRLGLSNRFFANFVRMSPEEVGGSLLEDAFTPEEASQFREINRRVIETEAPLVVEEWAETSGGRHYFQTIKFPLRDPGGQVSEIGGISFDLTERQQMEEALHESREFLSSILENASTPIYIVSAEGRMLLINRAYEDLFDMRRTEVIGSSVEVLFPPEMARRFGEINRQVVETEGPMVVELPVDAPDGHHDLQVVKFPLRDPEGRVEAVGGIAMDVTEQRRAEKKLRESEQQLKRAFEDAPIGVALVSPDNRFLRVNRALCKMLGYSEQELTAATSFELTASGDREASREYMATVRRSGKKWCSEQDTEAPESLEKRYIRKDGSVAWVLLNASLVTDEHGEPGYYVCQYQDITEKKRAEEALEQSERRYRAVVEDQTDLVCRYFPDTTLTFVNEAYCRYFGKDRNELIGTSFFWLIPEQNREDTQRHVESVLSEGVEVTYEVCVLGTDGEEYWQQWTDRPIWDDEGNVVEVQCVGRDITDRKRAEAALARERNLLHTVVNSADDAIFVKDTDHRFRLNNTAHAVWLGAESTRDLQGKTNADYWGEERSARHHADDRRVIDAGERIVGKEERIRHASGEERWISTTKVPLEDPEGKVEGLVAISRDITEKRQAEEALRDSEERFRGAFDGASTGVALVSTDNRYLRVNHALCEMLGYPEEELLDRSSLELTHPEDLEKSRWRTGYMLAEGGPDAVSLEKRYVRKDGQVVWAISDVSLVRDSEGKPSHFVSQFQNITERKRLEEELERQALRDPLTNLPNRRLFSERLQHALEHRNSSVALLFLDLDGFKDVNDTLGHDAGDTLLAEVAHRLQETVRPSDTVARLGGDEFTVLLEDADTGRAEGVARRIATALEAPFEVGGREFRVRASVGIALGSDERAGKARADKEASTLLLEADIAMYRAKRENKGSYAVHDSVASGQARERFEHRAGLTGALERDEFTFRYQPVVSLADGDIVGVEALLRWDHPESGILAPAEFLGIAEEMGLAVPLNKLALEQACRLGAGLIARPGSEPWVSVNLSARHLREPDLAEMVRVALAHTGLDPGRLVLEVTEQSAMDDAQEVDETLRALEACDVKLALDDFGTGYSSLSHLERVPAHFLKLDRAFLADLASDTRKAAMVRGVTELAHAIGMKVIAEGVETRDQLEALQECGCDLAQGYFFEMPLAATEASSLLARGAKSKDLQDFNGLGGG